MSTFWPQPADLGKSKLEAIMENRLQLAGLTGFKREHRFLPPRRWRFDFAFVSARVACECEGGGFSGGRHVRPTGFSSDLEKYSEAAALGWLVIRVNLPMIESGAAVEYIRRALAWQRS